MKFRQFSVIRFTIGNRAVKQRCYQRRVAGNNFPHAMSRIRIKRDEFICTNPFSVMLSGRKVLDRIDCLVLQTVINHFGSLFCCKRGISQGNPVSVKLCNIYLGAMERHLFPQRPKELFCRRYIDDYFMISSHKNNLIEVDF